LPGAPRSGSGSARPGRAAAARRCPAGPPPPPGTAGQAPRRPGVPV